MIEKIFVNQLNIPESLVFLIDEYCNTYHYILNIDHLSVQNVAPRIIITEICNLFFFSYCVLFANV